VSTRGGSALRLACRIWLEDNGRAFGEGPAALLDLIRTEGSINKAAASVGMAYPAAWLMMKTTEERLGFALLERRIGGKRGGGSTLTTAGEELLRRYRALQADVDRDLQRLFDHHFSDWSPGDASGLVSGAPEQAHQGEQPSRYRPL
jgi:molybdate transport system regulatory protein